MPQEIKSRADSRFVTFTQVATVEESRVFPESTVRQDEPRVGRAVLGVVLGVPFGLLWSAAFAMPWMQERFAWWGAPAPVIAIALAAVLAAVNWRRGSWPMYATSLVVAVPVLVGVSAGASAVLLTLLLLAAALWGAWRSGDLRRRRWARTRVLLVRREQTDVQVSAVVRHPFISSTEALLVTLTAVGRPDLSWCITEFQGSFFAPRVGDPMVVWFDPSEPAVATACAATPLIRALRPAQP